MRANLFASLIGILCVAGCGGGSLTGGGGGGGGGTPPTGANVQAVTVDTGPPELSGAAVNTLYTTITVCSPGSTTNCTTISHIQVDTGSSGLRIINTALGITLPLAADTSGNALAECTHFVDGASWGALRQADIKIGGETAANQRVQVIGDPAYPEPSACSSRGNQENTVASFGANGILGVGPFISDCGSSCTVAGGAVYFTCPTAAGNTTCSDSAMPEALQVANPVASFTTDNNGVTIQLPTVNSAGQLSVSGSLIFGINTQSNNQLGAAKVLTVTPDNGSFTTQYKLGTLADSFIDSGSNAYYFPDQSIMTCTRNTGFYCPSGTLSLSAVMQGVNGAAATVNFSVTNADTLFNTSSTIAAAGNLAASSTDINTPTDGNSGFDGSNSFDWGLPFFYGRTVTTAIEGKNTGNGGLGPYFAF